MVLFFYTCICFLLTALLWFLLKIIVVFGLDRMTF